MKFSEKYKEILFKDIEKIAKKLIDGIIESESLEIQIKDSDGSLMPDFCSSVTRPRLEKKASCLEIYINMNMIPDVPYRFMLERIAVDIAISLYGFRNKYDVTGQELHDLVNPIVSEINNI